MFRNPDNDEFARIFDDGASGDARMEWLRDGLKELREVPPHGLSNERMRDRLLGTGLAPAKPASAPWWSWAWAPVAAAALAVVVLPRFRQAEPTIVLDPAAISGDRVDLAVRPSLGREPSTRIGLPTPSGADLDPRDVETSIASAVEFAPTPPPTPSGAGRVARPSGRRPIAAASGTSTRRSQTPAPTPPSGRGRSETTALVAKADPSPRVALGAEAPESAGAAFRTALAPTDATVGVELDESYPLVLLAPEIDASTGAASATEVSSTANLSIGG